MSIIVNDRDVALQATTPRVEQVGLPSNVDIELSLPGLSSAFDATKEVRLSTTSQVFVVPKIGAIQPAAIEVTALLKAITGTPTFTLVDGTASFSVSGNKLTLLASSMTSATATFEVSVLFNSVTYKDRLTIGKIAEGSDAVVGLLSNESCTVAASDSGVVTGTALASAGGTFSIFDGVINKTTTGTVAYSVLSESGCDLSIDANGNYTLASVSANTGSAVLRAVYTRNGTPITIDKVYSVAKAIAGIVGSNAKLLYLSATSQVFQIPKTGSTTPSSIVLTATPQNLDAGAAYTWTTTPATTLTGSGATRTLAFTDMSTDIVKIDVTRDGLTDTITIVKVREGSDAIVGYLTNESVVVPADPSGVVASFTGAGGTFEVYQGLVRKTGSGITYSTPSLSGMTGNIDATSGVYTVTAMSADFGTATFRASMTINGTAVTLDKVYTIAKSRQGAAGAGGTGSRGTVNISAAITGTTWTDAAANTALSNAGYGVPQSRDIVTLYNTASSFSESKFYTGSAWATLDAYINGNLLVSRTIASAAIQTGAIGAEHINVASGGRNILSNSLPAAHTVGWVSGFSDTPNSALEVRSDYGPVGANAVASFATGSPNFTVFGHLNNNGGIGYPVVAGKRYEFSAYLDVYRALNAYVIIYWQNAAGETVLESLGTGTTQTQLGKTSLASFPRSVGFAVAPAGAVKMAFGIRCTTNGQNLPYVFSSMHYFGEAGTAQTSYSPWSEGGMTKIGPAGISTPNLSSISADIGKVTTGHLYGTVLTGGSGYDRTGYQWPSDVGLGNNVGGFHLSSAGLLIGNLGGGKYFQVTEAGNVYAPNFSIVNGTATFSGNLSAAGGTFSGSLSAATGTFAGNISAATGNISGTATINDASITTLKIAGQAVITAGYGVNEYINDVPGGTRLNTPVAAVTIPAGASGIIISGYVVLQGLGGNTTAFIGIWRNGVGVVKEVAVSVQNGFSYSYAITHYESLGAGTWDYSMTVSPAGGPVAVRQSFSSLVVQGAKR